MAKEIKQKPEQEEIVTVDNPQGMTGTSTTTEVKEVPDTDEVRFLKKILHIQEEGGFGRHLHDLIKERINEIKNVK